LYLDCDNLQKAMKGLGTDESMLIHILGNRSNDQRVKIRDQYKIMFGRVSNSTESNFYFN
jgi:hypothetical protein